MKTDFLCCLFPNVEDFEAELVRTMATSLVAEAALWPFEAAIEAERLTLELMKSIELVQLVYVEFSPRESSLDFCSFFLRRNFYFL